MIVDAERLAPAAVQEGIRDVLARPEFRGHAEEDSWLRRALHRLGEFLGDLLGVGAADGGEIALWIACLVLIALLAWLVVRLVRDRTARGVPPPPPPPPDPEVLRRRRVRDLRARARDAESRGDLVAALRLDFTALVVGLGEKGDLEYRDAWTNSELCRRGEPKPAVAATLVPLAERLDKKSFGGEPTSPEDVRELAGVVDQHLGAAA